MKRGVQAEARVPFGVALVAVWMSVGLSACYSPDDVGNLEAPDLDLLPRLTLEEVSRIGSVDDPDFGFSRIGSVDVDRDGNVWLFEWVAGELRVYSPNGDLLRRVGRRGDGPGEFSQYASPTLGLLGDTVWTFDTNSRRLTLFNRSGEVLSTAQAEEVRVPLHNPASTAAVDLNHIGADGRFVGDPGGTFAPPFDPSASWPFRTGRSEERRVGNECDD